MDRKSPEFLAAARERNRQWAERDPEHARSLRRERNRRWPWRKAASAAQQARRRCRVLGLPEGDVPKEIFARLHLLPCLYCGISPSMGADHALPLVLGGLNVIENLVPCCDRCNKKRGVEVARATQGLPSQASVLWPSAKILPASAQTHCYRGHSFAAHAYVDRRGYRTCRICRNEWQRQYRLARRLEAQP